MEMHWITPKAIFDRVHEENFVHHEIASILSPKAKCPLQVQSRGGTKRNIGAKAPSKAALNVISPCLIQSHVNMLTKSAGAKLHDLILSQATRVLGTLHRSVAVALVAVLDIGQTKGSTTVLVAGELGDSGLGILVLLELNDTGSS